MWRTWLLCHHIYFISFFFYWREGRRGPKKKLEEGVRSLVNHEKRWREKKERGGRWFSIPFASLRVRVMMEGRGGEQRRKTTSIGLGQCTKTFFSRFIWLSGLRFLGSLLIFTLFGLFSGKVYCSSCLWISLFFHFMFFFLQAIRSMGRKRLPYVCFICNSLAFVYFASMDFAPFCSRFFSGLLAAAWLPT